MVKEGNIYLHNENDELLVITRAAHSKLGFGVLFYSFENQMMHIELAGKTIELAGSSRFPVLFPKELRKNYRKIGEL